MSDVIRLVQRQVPLDSNVKFSLVNGSEVEGILVEIGRSHLLIETNNKLVTLLPNLIGSWELCKLEQHEGILGESLFDSEPKIDDQLVASLGNSPIESHEEEPDQKIREELIRIEAQFTAQIHATQITVKEPDFVFPLDDIPTKAADEARMIWDRCKNKYEYAKKVKELGATFGRIRPILYDFGKLAQRFPKSGSIMSHLAYLYWLTGLDKEAIENYESAAVISNKPDDWYNLAVLSVASDKDSACYALERFFSAASPCSERPAWYTFIRLMHLCESYNRILPWLTSQERVLGESDESMLINSGVYLLKITGREQEALELLRKLLAGWPVRELVEEALRHLGSRPVDSYAELVKRLELKTLKLKTSLDVVTKEVGRKPRGHIYRYIPERRFGFLMGEDNSNYFFHESAIVDDELLTQVKRFTPGAKISVIFEPTQGPKGPLAISISFSRTIDEMCQIASRFAHEGEYGKAISQIKKALALDPEFPQAQELYEKWRGFARISGVPRGSNPYARAKRAQLVERDLELSEKLFKEAIKKKDNLESAIKDLASLLNQLERSEEAIQLLHQHRDKIVNWRTAENMLLGLYQSAGRYQDAQALLKKQLDLVSEPGKRAHLLLGMANNEVRQEHYREAEGYLREVIKIQRDNLAAQRNLAMCLIKLERFDEAERILKSILGSTLDEKASELLDAIKQAKTTGESTQIDAIIIENTLLGFSGETSALAQFILDRCDYTGVPPKRARGTYFTGSDIKKLVELATELGTRRPRDRAGYYLSAAKITSLLDDGGDPSHFCKYLCRSLSSMADAMVAESRFLDVARDLYCEALSVYDGDRSRAKGEEQDAVNSLVRFLFATLGQTHVPLTPRIPTIDDSLERVFQNHPQPARAFDAIAYLVFRSRYAASRLLNPLFKKSTLRAMSLQYLNDKRIVLEQPIKEISDFLSLWTELQKKMLGDSRAIAAEFKFVGTLELAVASLEDRIVRVKNLIGRFFLDLDQERASQLLQILETCLDLCEQETFEEQERLSIQIDHRCQELLREIENSPTRLSVEEIYTIISGIKNRVQQRLEELYQRSLPQLSIRPVRDMESYAPDENQVIEVQLVVSNKAACSPADSVELVVNEDLELFALQAQKIGLNGSLRGGDQQILRFPLQVSSNAILSETFSLPVYVSYTSRFGEIANTPLQNLPVRLYSREDFREIDNPYAAYAEGGIVDGEMFYGREDLIGNIFDAVKKAKNQSKCVVIFGQKRAGKSSILHHLKKKLESQQEYLILDIGNVGALLDDYSSVPLLYRILWSILRVFRYEIEDKEAEGLPTIGVSFPSDQEFYAHPSPLIFFRDFFETFRRVCSKMKEWREKRPILLIDEFSYIYGQIIAGYIPADFMKNWKALLQANYFNAVLVGQDVMQKFKQAFPNEFGTTQDERVTYLRPEDAVRLIEDPIRIGGREGESRFRERAIQRILDLSGGSPFYIQIICNRLVEYMNRKKAILVTQADVEQVKDELIRGVNALGIDKFENLFNSGDTSGDAISDGDSLRVLSEIAKNGRGGSCNRNFIVCETGTHLDLILEDLVKRDVIENEGGNNFRIQVGIFREWLETNH